MKYFIYILWCSSDKTRYVGQTDDLTRRMRQHNSGQVDYTKSRRPLKLIYTEQFDSRIEAVQREKFLKSRSGRRFLEQML
jgi:putative endonuclease